jgi:hypothetical protein
MLELDYVSVGQSGFVPISIKLMVVTKLEPIGVHDVK